MKFIHFQILPETLDDSDGDYNGMSGIYALGDDGRFYWYDDGEMTWVEASRFNDRPVLSSAESLRQWELNRQTKEVNDGR